MPYEKLLEEIGLTGGEITVYMTLLKLGQTTTGKIIENAGISSGKIYEILDKLIHKGLASFIIHEKTKIFRAADPERILDYVEEKEKQHELQKEELRKVLPQMKALRQSFLETNSSTMLKGFRGVQTAAYEALHSLKKGDEVIGMGLISAKGQEFNIMWRQWNLERIKKRIPCRVIFSDRGEHYSIFKKMKLTRVRVISGVTPAALDVIGSTAFIFTHKEPGCLVIKSQEITQTFRQIFDNLWKTGKP